MKSRKLTLRTIQIILISFFTFSLSAQTISVSGKKSWTDTGIDLKAGQQLTITAKGKVYANASVFGGPEGISNHPEWDSYCVIKGKPHVGLILKVGTAAPVFIGKKSSHTVSNDGRLYFGINDTDLGNNKGEFSVYISNRLPDPFGLNTITVSGRKIWTDTGIDVWKDQKINVTASGKVYANSTVFGGPGGILNRPDWDSYCVVKGKPHVGLIIKIGNETPAFLGTQYTYTAPQSGRIFLGVNDNDVGNNKGEFTVNLSYGKKKEFAGGDIIVSGRQKWAPSGLHVKKGQTLKISAGGKVYANSSVFGSPDGITNRPDWDAYCIIKGKAHVGLIAKIGNGQAFFVGSALNMQAIETGELFFMVNDSDLGNNKGEFNVSVVIE